MARQYTGVMPLVGLANRANIVVERTASVKELVTGGDAVDALDRHRGLPGGRSRVVRLLGRLRALRALLERRFLGLSADEIRYTFEDVRAELRATRAELKDELAALRRDIERLGRSGEREDEDEDKPIAEA